MLTIIKVNFKRLKMQAVLLCLLVVCQLAFGHVASQALAGKSPATKIAVEMNDVGEYGAKYVAGLAAIEGLEIFEVDGEISFEEVFSDSSFIGALVISEDFSELCLAGSSYAVKFYAAPGVADNTLVQQYLMLELTILRSEIILGDAQRALGIEDAAAVTPDSSMQMISLEYVGPVGQIPFSDIPVFGIPSLLLLLAFLMASSFAPGLDDKRTLRWSLAAQLRSFFAAVITLLIVWFAAAGVYVLAMRLGFKTAIEPAVCTALFALVFYAVSLGTLFAAAGLRKYASAFFALWFVLNMTAGGGLWDRGLYEAWLVPILLVSAVLSGTGGSAGGTVALVLCALVSLFIGVALPAAYRRRISDVTQ